MKSPQEFPAAWRNVTDVPEDSRGLVLALVMLHALVLPRGRAVMWEADQLVRAELLGRDNYAANRAMLDAMTLAEVGQMATWEAPHTFEQLALHHPDILATLRGKAAVK